MFHIMANAALSTGKLCARSISFFELMIMIPPHGDRISARLAYKIFRHRRSSLNFDRDYAISAT